MMIFMYYLPKSALITVAQQTCSDCMISPQNRGLGYPTLQVEISLYVKLTAASIGMPEKISNDRSALFSLKQQSNLYQWENQLNDLIIFNHRLKMSQPDKKNKQIFESIMVDEEEGAKNSLTTSNLSSPQAKLNSKPTKYWKNIFLTAFIVLILGVVFYSAFDVILRAEISKYNQAMKEESEQALKAERLKYNHMLQVAVKESERVLKVERQKSGKLDATIKQQSETITQKQTIVKGLMDQIASLKNQLKASSSQLQKLKAQPPAPKPSQKAIVKPEPDGPNVVIDIEYATKGYAPLPINPLRENSEGKRIEDALYKDEATRKKRTEYMQQRFKFVNSYTHLTSLVLAKYNIINSEEQLKKGIEDNQREWLRLEAKFQLSRVREELPMCIVVPSFNNNANFRIEYSLNSLFTQNYSNYKVVIVNDASTDNSDPLYRSFFRFYAIDKQRYTYIENSRRVTALQNIYFASMNHCGKDSIVLNLDGDDELIGRNVLQVFNWAYQSKKAGVIYSNFYWFLQPQRAWQGFTIEYTDQQKKGNHYRGVNQKFSHLRSFRTELIYQIDPKDLQDQKGSFFTIAADMALMFPLMQLSCARVNKIEREFNYLYNRGTGLNDDVVYGKRQNEVDRIVRSRKKYDCFKEFDEKMKQLPALSPVKQIAKDNQSNAVVNVEYTWKEYGSLPIDPFKKNSEGKKIEDVLYKDEETRKKRTEFIQERANFVQANSKLSGLLLSKYNLVSSEEQLKKAVEDNQKDWLRLEAKFQLSKINQELPMCLIVPSFNNNARFRIQSNLNSLFTQNYSNYRVVIVNDASLDGSDELYRSFFRFYAIDKQRYTYIENVWRTFALQNIYFASMNHCGKDSIVAIVNGDDELIGRNVLQVFNWAYQTKKAGVIYSNYYKFQQPQSVEQGWTTEYAEDVKKGNLFRSTPLKFSLLRTFRNQLIFKIDVKDLKNQDGYFFTVAYDLALFIPMMEMSCGRVHKIEGEFDYIYNLNTGMNDDYKRQVEVERRVRSQKKYECLKDFDQRMNK